MCNFLSGPRRPGGGMSATEPGTCCGLPLVRMVYLTSRTGDREPRWFCRRFVALHPGEFVHAPPDPTPSPRGEA